MAASKKYKLFSKSADGGKAVCAFFLSADGCRNGDKCAFLHETPGKTPPTPALESESGVSSEESVGEEDIQRKAKKRKNGQTDTSPKKQSTTNNKKRKTNPQDQKVVQQQRPNSNKAASKKERNDNSGSSNGFQSFLSNLPVASFSLPNPEATPLKADKKEKQVENNTPAKKEPAEASPYVVPNSTETGRFWRDAVVKTQKHASFTTSYDYAKWKEQGMGEWIKAKKFGSWCESHPQAIAMDCEMCETKDPLSGAKNSKALCRFSVVNAENPDEVLIDTLVKPSWPVTDYRTRINGISKADLDNVEFTLRHAQAFMMKLCSDETVIIGHAVHNDLISLNMEHHCVADSVCLFQAKDSPNSAVSLKDLVSTIHQKKMPETHDSVNDSKMALDCVRHWVEKGGKVEPVERTSKSKNAQLFIHRIPREVNEKALGLLILTHTSVQTLSVDDIEFSGDTGKTHVTFRSARHANLAFDSLEGVAEEDKSGRLQKKVYLRKGGYIRIRKMTHSHSKDDQRRKSM